MRNGHVRHGVLGVGVIVVLLVGLAIFSRAHLGQRTYYGAFEHVGGVRAGDEVRVAGIEVGEVSATELNGRNVILTMKVDRSVEVAADGYATIKLSTLLGQRYVDLTLGEASDPAPDGEIGLLSGNRAPYDLQQTIEAGTPILAGIDAQDRFGSIDTLNQQLRDAPAVATPTFESLTQMARLLTDRRDQIEQLLVDTRAVTEVVNSSHGQLAVLVGQGRSLAEKITVREQLVTRMLDGIAQLSEQAQAIGIENADQFAPIMLNINTITEGLEKNRDNLRTLLQILPVTARLMTNALGDGPYANGYLPWGVFPDNWLCLARVVDGC